jgi:hypothetical protein
VWAHHVADPRVLRLCDCVSLCVLCACVIRARARPIIATIERRLARGAAKEREREGDPRLISHLVRSLPLPPSLPRRVTKLRLFPSSHPHPEPGPGAPLESSVPPYTRAELAHVSPCGRATAHAPLAFFSLIAPRVCVCAVPWSAHNLEKGPPTPLPRTCIRRRACAPDAEEVVATEEEIVRVGVCYRKEAASEKIYPRWETHVPAPVLSLSLLCSSATLPLVLALALALTHTLTLTRNRYRSIGRPLAQLSFFKTRTEGERVTRRSRASTAGKESECQRNIARD